MATKTKTKTKAKKTKIKKTKTKTKKKTNPNELEALFAQTVSYEIAIAAILQVLARISPATAELIQQALAERRLTSEVQEHPMLVEKIEMYETMIETENAKNFQ